MMAIRLDRQTKKRISQLAEMTGRSQSYYMREALQKYLEDIEDVYTALYRLENPGKTISLEDMKKEFKKL